jgi:hypothetical protein
MGVSALLAGGIMTAAREALVWDAARLGVFANHMAIAVIAVGGIELLLFSVAWHAFPALRRGH